MYCKYLGKIVFSYRILVHLYRKAKGEEREGLREKEGQGIQVVLRCSKWGCEGLSFL